MFSININAVWLIVMNGIQRNATNAQIRGKETTRYMMVTVPHFTAWAGRTKYQADRYLLDWVYDILACRNCLGVHAEQLYLLAEERRRTPVEVTSWWIYKVVSTQIPVKHVTALIILPLTFELSLYHILDHEKQLNCQKISPSFCHTSEIFCACHLSSLLWTRLFYPLAYRCHGFLC